MLKWVSHYCRMNEECDPHKYMKARTTGKRPRGWPRL